MATHSLNAIKKNKKLYNKLKRNLEKRLALLEEMKALHKRNWEKAKKQVENAKMVLKSQLPIEAILKIK